LNELIAQLFLGVKKLHEKNLVLRNINLNTITVTQNAFDRYHLKYNINMVAQALDDNLSPEGLEIKDSIPPELFSNIENNKINIDASLYRKADKKHLDYYALGQILDILRITFQRKDSRLLKLTSALTEAYPLYQPLHVYFYEFFKPNPSFYLNIIARKFAGTEVNLSNDVFLSMLKNLKKIYYMMTNLVDYLNLLEDKHTPATINNILYKMIHLKKAIEEFKNNDVKAIEIKKVIDNIEQIADKINLHYKNVILQQLSQMITNNLRFSLPEKIKNTFFHDFHHRENIHQCLQYLYSDYMMKKLRHLNNAEFMTILMIMRANVEKYIKKKGFIESQNVILIIQISFILAYKLHIDQTTTLQLWSKWFDVDIQKLKNGEREFLQEMNHALIHDPFFASSSIEIPENRSSM